MRLRLRVIFLRFEAENVLESFSICDSIKYYVLKSRVISSSPCANQSLSWNPRFQGAGWVGRSVSNLNMQTKGLSFLVYLLSVNAEYCASNPRSSEEPERNVTNIWLPLDTRPSRTEPLQNRPSEGELAEAPS